MELKAKVVYLGDSASDLIYDRDYVGEFRVNTNSQPLVLREEPSTDSEQLTLMPKNAAVDGTGFIDITGKWLLCQYTEDSNTLIGFAYISYLKKEDEK